MIDPDIEVSAGVLAVLLEVLNDLGLAVGAGRVMRWPWVLGFWSVVGLTGIPLWRDCAHFFDTVPGWAVLSAGLWFMFLLVTLGVTVARMGYIPAEPPA